MDTLELGTYVVVEYTDEQSMAVIPSQWMKSPYEACWPPYINSKRSHNAAKKKEVPADNWKVFAVKEWFRTSDWNAANKKMHHLEVTSNIESSDDDNRGRFKRAKRSSTKSQWYDRSSSSSLSPHSQPSLSKHKKLSKTRKVSNKTSVLESFDKANQLPIPPAAQSTHSTPNSFQEYNTEVNYSLEYEHTPKKRSSWAPMQTTPSGNTMISCSELEPIFTRIFEVLEQIQAQQRCLKRLISEKTKEKSSEEFPMFQNLPINSQEQLCDIERKLLDGKFQTSMVTYLLGFSGRSLPETTRRMLKETMGNELAKFYNLSGKGRHGKKGFQQLRLYKVIFAAIREVYSEAKETDFRASVVHWLDGAKDRDGGRKMRQADDSIKL